MKKSDEKVVRKKTDRQKLDLFNIDRKMKSSFDIFSQSYLQISFAFVKK